MSKAASAKIPSDSSCLDQLVTAYDEDARLRDRLRLGDDWTRRWSSTWQVGAGEVCWPVRDMAHVPVLLSRPMRGFTWRAKQRHRPGLEMMVSTGRKHGFESMEEVRLLVALDFLRASEVLSQPFRLDFEYVGGQAWHIPDFLGVIGGGMWLMDVRPMELIKDDEPEHIPAFLEPGWYQRHLASAAGSASKIVRRTAAVRLVQWAMGGSLDDAAKFLGIPLIQTSSFSGRDARWPLRSGCDPVEFDKALRALASELHSPRQPLIDYRRRRHALHEWVISPDAWNALLQGLHRPLHATQIGLGDRKRQAASVYVWTLITQGEHLFAPRPLEAAQPPEVRQQWARRRNTTWFQLTRPDPMSHYAEMRRILAEYAQQLTRHIDSGVEQTRHPESHTQ
ncbi:hypothetical protein ACFWII_37640 [Streptomyces sp. NPDC127063]|uniref:hypothetical protein n=1 Tax=Streptomyces sp. NPDC127063 TaxID=3347123 RepID=UPI00366100EB